MRRFLSCRPASRALVQHVLACGFVAIAALSLSHAEPVKSTSESSKDAKPAAEAKVDVRFTDGSVLKLASCFWVTVRNAPELCT